MKLFHKNEINPFPVSDKVTFRNADKTITLIVRKETINLIKSLKTLSPRLQSCTDETPKAEQTEVALAFGSAIFGDEQAHKLFEFYDNSPLAMITACGMYFQGNLSKKITKAQKAK